MPPARGRKAGDTLSVEMKFVPTPLTGAVVVEVERREDRRGFFARSFCVREFAAQGLDVNVAQANLAGTFVKGTVRGLHYQVPPSTETKLIRCTYGAIFDVIVDLRPGSPTYLQHYGVELTAENQRAIYVPPMFAHGYQALVDGTELTYLMGDFYDPACERGLRHDDPALGIRWPLPVTLISEKDAAWPLL